MFYFTNDQIDEIEKRLAVRAKKDTDFDPIATASEDDLVAIIHNGRNMICRLDKLPGRLVAKRYNDISPELLEESVLEVPTAFSIGVLKTLLGIEEMPEFDNDTPYSKHSFVQHVDENGILRGYIFTDDKSAGYWDYSVVEEVNYNTILGELGDIISEFNEGGRVYVLENYFTDGKANRTLADEDGKNLKEYYALKTDIPDVNREIAEAIAVKLDNDPKGEHDLPIYIKYDPLTGHGKSEVIDSLHTPGDIHSDSDIYADGGVSARGIASLAMGSGGGTGTITEIQIDGVTQPSVEGVVNLPAYPVWNTLAGKPVFASVATSGSYNDLIDKPSIPQGTVTSIGMTVPLGLSVNPTAITDSGIFAISFTDGYSIPTIDAQNAWDAKYDKDPAGIPITDLSDDVRTSLSKADTALESVTNLKTGLASKGAHDLPIYLNADSQAVTIDSLSVPGNIQSTNGGVSANGIASLAISGGGSQGTVTAINFEGSPEQIYTPSDGLITLPDYPTAEDLILDGLASQDYVASYFASNFTQSNIKNTLGISDWALASTKPSYNFSEIGSKPTTLAGYNITDAHITNGVVTLGQNTITPATLNNGKIPLSQIPDAILGQMLYGGTVNESGVVTLSQNAKDKWGITSLTLTSINYADYEGGFFIASANGSSGVPSSLGVLVGDWIIATSAGWGKIDNTDAVTGVKGSAESNYRIGNVNITPANIGLGNVENTALSTWAGTNNITTLGTITTGVWHGSAIGYDYLANAVQSSLGKADSAIQGIKVNSGSVITPDANKIVNITDVASANALATLKTGLTSKGSHNLPVYLNSSAQAVVIDSLSVPGDIQSTGGGVSAEGIASLAINGGGGQGTITQIQIDGVVQPESDGVVNLPAYPTWATLSGRPSLATVATTGSYNDLTDKPSIPQGTVTSIGMTVPTGLSVSPSAITTSGTFAITLISGYSIPTIENQNTWSAKQNALAFDGTYDASTNKVATKSTVTNAINALDVSYISGFGAGKTLASLTETDGKIAATFQNISITKSQVSDFPTTWALDNITGADDLKAIEALTGTSGFLKKTAANRWALDTDVASGTALSGVSTRVGTLEGYFTSGVANNAAKLGGQLPSYYAVAADYTKTSDFQSFSIKVGTTTLGTYSPTSALILSLVAGSNIAFDTDATNHKLTIRNTYSYTLPMASSDSRGGIRVGNTLNIDSNGILNANIYDGLDSGSTTYSLSAKQGKALKTALDTLKTGLTSKGAHNLPIYLNSNAQAVAIDALSVSGNVESTAGGVSAMGIASLALNGGGGQGTLTQIQVNGVALADTSGVVNITATTGNAAGKIAIAGQQIPVYGLGSFAYLSSLAFTDLSSHPTTLGGYGITDAKIANGVITLGGNTITPLTSHQTLYNLVINNSAGTAQITYKPAVSGTYALTLTKAMVGLSNVENTKLSTWAGSSNITTLGTITTGKWQGTAIADSYIASAATWNAKQNAISDLATIRSNASNGNTAYGWGNHADAGYFAASSFTKANIKSTLGISDWALAASKPTYAFSEITSTVTNAQLAGSIANSKLASAGKFTIGSTAIELGTTYTAANFRSYLGLGGAATYGATSSVTDGGTSLVTSGGVYSYVNALLTAAMKIEGETTTAISDGSTTNPVVIGGQSVSAYKGMVVFYGSKEFVWVGTAWKELGDESSFALKTTTVSGTGYLTGGGALSSNQTIDIASSVKTKIDNGATAYGWGNHANAGYAIAANLGTASTHAHWDYVTAIGVSGNTLTWSKGGTAQTAITVPYATKATQDNDGTAFKGNYLRKVTVARNTINDFNTFESMTMTGRGDPATGASLLHAPWTGGGPAGGYGTLTYIWGIYGIQMAWGYYNNHIYIRNKYYNDSTAVWSDSWSTVALTSDNVASATKLQNARNIWGQSFNGTAAISGDMSGVGNIGFSASGKNIGGTMYFDTTNHRVGINDSTPSCAFDVTGDVQASGGIAAGGILNLAYNGAGTQGTLTQIQVNGRALTDTSGIVNIPLANTTSTGDGAMSHSDKLKLDGIATGATNVNTDTVAGWGYIKNAAGIQNALGYIAARETKKSRLVTGNEYRFQTGDNDCINIWIVSAASVNLYLPYDWDYQTPLRLIIANAYSGSVTVKYKATSGTQKIYSQSDTISLSLGRAALVEMIQFYNASVGGEVTFVTMSSYLQRSIS